MILTENVMPEHNLCYVGAIVVLILKQYDYYMPVSDLYEQYKIREEYPVTMINFILSIDWLFLCNMVKYDNDGGGIQLCK